MPHILNGHKCNICRWWFFKADLRDKMPRLTGCFSNEVWGRCFNTGEKRLEKWRTPEANEPSTHMFVDGTLYTMSGLACGYGEHRNEFRDQPRECERCGHKFTEDRLLSVCLCDGCEGEVING